MVQLHKSTGLRWRTYRYCEGLLYDYCSYEKLIKEREEAIINPFRVVDENIGGGRNTIISNDTERIASALVEDDRLNQLNKEYEAISESLEMLSDENRKVITLAYFVKPRTKTWTGIAIECDYSIRQCYRIRDKVIESIANKLGMV